jgi:hypothetical protein
LFFVLFCFFALVFQFGPLFFAENSNSSSGKNIECIETDDSPPNKKLKTEPPGK